MITALTVGTVAHSSMARAQTVINYFGAPESVSIQLGGIYQFTLAGEQGGNGSLGQASQAGALARSSLAKTPLTLAMF